MRAVLWTASLLLLSCSRVVRTKGSPGRWHPGVSCGLVAVCPCAHGFVR